MTKSEIVTYATAPQGKPVNGDGRKDAGTPAFEGKCEELKGHVFDVRGAIDAFFVTMRELTKMIGRTYKNDSDVKM